MTTLLAVAAVVNEVHRNHSDEHISPPRGGVGMDEAADQLAQAIGAQWRREEERRRIHDPFPLPVRWHSASAVLSDHWANIRCAPAGTDPGPLALTGQLDRVVDVYRRIPSLRLVVLGRAGSGKTILTIRFVLDLLDGRASVDSIPVIFSLGSWSPTTTSLRDWLSVQLIRDHPGLAAPSPTGASLATALVDAGRILAVLDGFDEIADGLHRAALQALSATTIAMVLTSRPDEYATAVSAAGVLSAAAGIELDDLTLTDLAHYLPRTTRRTTANTTMSVWGPVLAHLREDPSSPAAINLTVVLSTPLMVVLARTIYSDTPDHHPAELLNIERFGTPQALEDHLLDTFIPTAYQGERTIARSSRQRQWAADDAQRWLSCLATHLHQLGTRDIAWWQLGKTVPIPARILAFGLAFGITLAFALTIGLAFTLPRGGNSGIAVGPTVGLAFGLIVGLVRSFTVGFVSALGFGVVEGLLRAWAGDSAGEIVAALAAGLMVGLIGGLTSNDPRPARVQLRLHGHAKQILTTLSARTAVGCVVGFALGFADELTLRLRLGDDLTYGLAQGYWVGLEVLLTFGVTFGIARGFTDALEAPIDISTAVSPTNLLATDRRRTTFQSLTLGLALGLTIGLVRAFAVGRPIGLAHGLEFGVVSGLAFSLAFGLTGSAWGRWLILTRIWRPLTGRLPWRVGAFLDDAYQRGILRQSGSVYQFRHARLQDHLTDLPLTGRSGVAPGSAPELSA